MLRIVVDENAEAGPMLRLEGQVVGPWVGELSRVCEPLLGRSAGLALDLSSVSFVSREGAELLGRLRERSARLLHCSPFVTEQLRSGRGAGTSDAPPAEAGGHRS